jgi:hypothetical protein
MWQSLSHGANYKAAYCLAVCPAGEDVIGPYLTARPKHLQDVVRPLQDKEETVYVVAGSDAEGHVARRFANKKTKRIGNGLRPRSIALFLQGLPRTFQCDQAAGIDATYHFNFIGQEPRQATIVIHDQTINVREGLIGNAGLQVTTDSQWWLGFLAKERSLLWGLLRRKLRLRGSPRLLLAFGECFPS